MVTVIAEAIDRETVWYHGVTTLADHYDGYPHIRTWTQAAAVEGLERGAPSNLPVTIREERWTQLPEEPDDLPWG